jgi:SIR2-like protein
MTLATETRQDKLARLATRICAGEVVFFIGAGFSLDSEKNTTSLLIARLLARFEALAETLIAVGNPEAVAAARRLRTGLRVTFTLHNERPEGTEFSNLFDNTKPSDQRPSVFSATLTSLGQNYYIINDWICSGFDNLIEHLTTGVPADFTSRVNAREIALLRVYSPTATLDPIDVDWLTGLHRHVREHHGPPSERFVAGKVLFLDTLGFNSDAVMGGAPMDPDLDVVACRSASRLRMRHHVLARFAAEGLCPILVTTNYDLLLDCAYRLAGMLPLKPPIDQWPADLGTPLDRAVSLKLPLNRRYRHFSRVAEAAQFFTYGDAHQSAVIHKIHGCVEMYRRARRATTNTRDESFELIRRVLPTIVFTFREIQNWREDSWSRDHLTTLMRTRTIVFAGYSGADPVIHDTFRTVYEEVASYRTANADAPAGPDDAIHGARARAFFTDREQVGSFHGLEILRAASTAAGDPSSDVTDHPNLLTFFLGDTGQFPAIDELFV